MTEINWGLLQSDPIGQQAKAYSYADKIAQNAIRDRSQAAQYQAGGQYAGGDYTGASGTLARSGDIPQAEQMQQTGQQNAAKGQQYLAQALPVFQQVAQAHANDPDKGAAALGSAFDHVAAEAQQMTGASPQAIASLRQSLVTDPQGTLARLQAQVPVEYKTAGDTLFQFRNGVNTGTFEGQKNVVVPQGGQVIQTGGAGGSIAPGAGGLQQPVGGTPNAPGGSSIIPTADPNAMHAIESSGNPNAVSPAGAVGVSQTMPATLQSPGFGVQPAANNSPQEQQRVGDQYLQGLNAHYGNPVLAHIAYNWGPGNTDKWLQAGGDFSKLPPETQQYLGRIAVAQAVPQQGQQPQGVQQQPGGARVIASNATPIDHGAIDNDVRIWLASKGTIQPNYGMGAAGFSMRQAFDTAKNRLMGELNVTPEDVASGQAIRKADTASLSSLQKQADNIKAFEGTASRNADLALTLLDKGGPQGQAPILNRWTQEYRKWIAGDQHVSQYTAALGTFADEYAKVVAGQNGATDSVRAAAYDRINDSMNKGTIRAVIGTMKQEMANRSASNDEQIGTIKSRLGASSPPPSDNIPTMSPIEASKAPPGTKFRGTDGVVRVVKGQK